MTEDQANDIYQQIEAMRKEFQGSISRIERKLDPISDAYNAASKLGAWAKYLLYFIATMVGIALTFRELFKKN